MATIYLSLSTQVAKSTFFMKSRIFPSSLAPFNNGKQMFWFRNMPVPLEKKLGLGNKEIEVDVPFRDHFKELFKLFDSSKEVVK